MCLASLFNEAWEITGSTWLSIKVNLVHANWLWKVDRAVACGPCQGSHVIELLISLFQDLFLGFLHLGIWFIYDVHTCAREDQPEHLTQSSCSAILAAWDKEWASFLSNFLILNKATDLTLNKYPEWLLFFPCIFFYLENIFRKQKSMKNNKNLISCTQYLKLKH